MNRRLPLMLIFGIVLVPTLFQLTRWFVLAPAPLLTISLSGPENVTVTGYYSAGGVTNIFNGTLPARIAVRARRFECEFRKESNQGLLRLEITGVGQNDNVAAGEHGVRALIDRRPFHRTMALTAF